MPTAFYFNMVDPSMNSVKQKTFLFGRELLMQLSLWEYMDTISSNRF